MAGYLMTGSPVLSSRTDSREPSIVTAGSEEAAISPAPACYRRGFDMPRLPLTACASSLALAVSCGGAAPAPVPAPAPAFAPAPLGEIPIIHPARYLVPDAAWIERTAEGLDRVVVSGRRLEIRNVETIHLAPADPEIAGGAMAPSWIAKGPSRYVFWKNRELYGAETFTGELHRIATLPAEPDRAFAWLDGTGLIVHGGAFAVPAAGGAPKPLPLAAVADAVAADARRALVFDAFGRARLTLDGGGSFTEITSSLGPATQVRVRGDEIAVTLRDGSERFIEPSGEVRDDRTGHLPGPGKPLPDVIDAWPRGAERGALDAAVRSGLPLGDGGALIAARGLVGRLDLAAGRTTSVVPLPETAQADCVPVRAGTSILLACADRQRALVIDVSGAPRVERSFDLAGAPDLDRFAAADGEALGYLGPCDGSPPPLRDAAGGGEGYNHSPARSPVFCARAGHDEWIEHRLDPSDAPDVIAWIPRPAGGAVALVGRQGTFLPDAERITVKGALRVVRVARNEPPLAMPSYRSSSSTVLRRSLHARADDVIEGWIPSGSGMPGSTAVTFDAGGHPRAYPPPARSSQMVTSGRFAITKGEDDQLFETIDWGKHWSPIEGPPGAGNAHPSFCSPVGCRVGSFVRLGWSADGGAQERAPKDKPSSARSSPPPPLVELACSFDGAPEGKRASDSYAFGYVPGAQQRGSMPVRVGAQGIALFPWNGPQAAMTGDVDLAWIPPLDLGAPLRRATLPIGAAGLGSNTYRPYEVKLGYLLGPGGDLDLFPIGYREGCLASLLDLAGITRPLGGCAEDHAVGVDLGGHVVLLQAAWDGLVISAADAAPRRKAEGEAVSGKGTSKAKEPEAASPKIAAALHELMRNPGAGAGRGFLLGMGSRDGAPVAVLVDVFGEALLVPVDPERGTLGGEERLKPLGALMLGSEPGCAAAAGEARVVLPFDHEIGIDRTKLRGVLPSAMGGVAVLRWSKDRACLDAVEIGVRDERYDMDLGMYEGTSSLRKLIGRFAPGGAKGKGGSAALVLISGGAELRQKVACSKAGPPAVEP
jgi:hypothetical protein